MAALAREYYVPPEQRAYTYEQLRQELREEARRQNERMAAERRECEQRRIAERLGHSGIPPRFQDRRLDNWHNRTEDHRRAHATASAYAQRFPQLREQGTCLRLAGGPGTGKTHLACGILASVIEQGYTGAFVTMSELLRMIRATYQAGAERHESEVIDDFIAPDLLALDEVGVAIGNAETRRTLLFDVLNGRYQARRPTILIGNLTPQEIDQYLGERIADRLAEDGGLTIDCRWASERTQR
ncbi:MAG: ATP-binding protein [Halomonas sp.]